MRILTRSDVQRLLPMSEAVVVVRKAFCELSQGTATIPQRVALWPEKHGGVTLVMPGYLAELDALGVKVVSVHDKNPQRNQPSIYGVLMLVEAATGKPLALMEAAYLTALRTGAATGLATDLLARKDARVAAIFGGGAQARTQLLGVCAVRQLERVWVWTRRPEQARSLIEEMGPLMSGTVEMLSANSPAQAMAEVDVICTATTSHVPLLHGSDLRPGTHVNAIGAYTPKMRETDSTTLRRASKIVVDSRPAALAEAGDILLAIAEGAISQDSIHAEIGEIAAGVKPGREADDEITFFKSVGKAAQDVAVAQAVHQRAVEQGIGVEVDLG